jgi:hypothetical protein
MFMEGEGRGRAEKDTEKSLYDANVLQVSPFKLLFFIKYLKKVNRQNLQAGSNTCNKV